MQSHFVLFIAMVLSFPGLQASAADIAPLQEKPSATPVALPSIAELQQRLDSLTPVYAAPVRDALLPLGTAKSTLQLLGATLSQNNVVMRGDCPELDGSANIKLSLFWRPTTRIASSVPIDITWWDYLCVISRTDKFRAGPQPENQESQGAQAWEPGSIYRQDYEVDLKGVASAFSGRGYLLVCLAAPPGRTEAERTVQNLPIRLKPAIEDRAISQTSLERAKVVSERIIAKFVRLGYGATTRLEVPPEWQTGNRRLAVISSLSYRSLPQGQSACEIVLNKGETRSASFALASGTMTARCDYDSFEPAQANHERAPIFESRDSAMLDPRGRPVQLHTYIGIVDIPPSVQSVQSIEFSCSAQVLLDILGVVLIP